MNDQQDDRRRFARIALDAKVRVDHESIGSCIFMTRDISDAGVFLLVGDDPFPPLGSSVHVRIEDLALETPVLQMRVVRKEESGFGLKFVTP